VLAQPASSIRLGHRGSTSGYATSRRATAANDGSVDRNICGPVRRDQRLEQLLAAGEHLVERILKMRRRLREFLSHLVDVFFVALFDFFAE
jgi:hypothetical protein